MFSFHKPKVYRSSTGCCICKAKSSSSRFTDSKKYEEDFLKCFQLSTPRQGEICNACVLLVKRWKKLPPGSIRNWKHVVDARAGPGMKSMTKFKSKNRKLFENSEKANINKTKEFEREDSPELSDKSEANEDGDIAEVDSLSEEGVSGNSSRTGSPRASDGEDSNDPMKGRRLKSKAKRRNLVDCDISDFIDEEYWRQERTCCGLIFRGMNGEVLIDNRFWAPCKARLAMCKVRCTDKPKSESDNVDNVANKTFCDSSSDSGYDESSNQGITVDSAFKKDQLCIEENSHIYKSN